MLKDEEPIAERSTPQRHVALLDAVLERIRNGVRVSPLDIETRQPLLDWPNGEDQPPTESEVRAWFAREHERPFFFFCIATNVPLHAEDPSNPKSEVVGRFQCSVLHDNPKYVVTMK